VLEKAFLFYILIDCKKFYFASFNPKNHPDVKNGKISVNNYTNNFFELFGSI
jgi:hypothetical protein